MLVGKDNYLINALIDTKDAELTFPCTNCTDSCSIQDEAKYYKLNISETLPCIYNNHECK